MKSKKIWTGMLVVILAFGMTAVGCNSLQKLDELAGTWVFESMGEDVKVTITGTEWVCHINGIEYDTGKLRRGRDIVTIYSNTQKKIIGDVTKTDETTVSMTLDIGRFVGTFTGVKR